MPLPPLCRLTSRHTNLPHPYSPYTSLRRHSPLPPGTHARTRPRPGAPLARLDMPFTGHCGLTSRHTNPPSGQVLPSPFIAHLARTYTNPPHLPPHTHSPLIPRPASPRPAPHPPTPTLPTPPHLPTPLTRPPKNSQRRNWSANWPNEWWRSNRGTRISSSRWGGRPAWILILYPASAPRSPPGTSMPLPQVWHVGPPGCATCWRVVC